MNSSTQAPVRAARAHRTANEPKTRAKGAALDQPVAPTPTWREQVRDLLSEVQDRLEVANDIPALESSEHGWMARTLIHDVLDLISQHRHLLNVGNSGDYDEAFGMPAHAYIVAAMHLPDTAPGLLEILEPVAVRLEAISTIAGECGLKDVPPLQNARSEEALVPAFMEGKAVCADMVAAAETFEGSDEAALEAAYRGPGVPQNVFTERFFDKVVQRPELRRGFLAALASKLVGGDSSDQIRSLRYEEWFGGAAVRYLAGGQPATVLVDSVRENLTNLATVAKEMFERGLLDQDTSEQLKEASDAAFQAELSLSMADTRQALQEVRKHVHRARTSVGMARNSQEPEHVKLAQALLDLHRRLNTFLGGLTEEDQKGPQSPLGELIDRVSVYIEAAEHAPDGDDTLYRAEAPGSFSSQAEEAVTRGDEEEALRLLPQLRDALAAEIAKSGEFDGRWPALRTSLHLVREFLSDTSSELHDTAVSADGRPDRNRLEVARQAGCWLGRMASVFATGRTPTPSDWRAMREAAGAVQSGVINDIDSAEEIAQRLDRAIDMASVLLQDQMPKHFAEGGALRAKDAGRVIVATAE
ncbi:hypothetical protein [Ramlibacter sp.]|uniref:hypothetical protein n=1 Tax=Ramlibacter sp. TaxID=1917967 RepID=UPI0026092513|nr:hypothetical protein [Ramlibacter sp.]MDB5956747.1 hypothetical protein [Ramlibacter sp.]